MAVLTNAALIAACAALISSCAMGPDFMRPVTKADDAAGFINEATVQSTEQHSMSLWWDNIDDPLLNDYVAQLLDQNLQLVEASERIVQARARVAYDAGAYYPSLGFDSSGGRSFSNNALTGERAYSNSYNAELRSTWEIDLFGKIGRSVEAADASYIASVYDREALVHTLIAELLNLRVEIAANKQHLGLALETVENRKNTLEIIERRYELGASNTKPQDVLKARDNVTSVQADVHRYQRLLADAIYRLDVMLGHAPGKTKPLEVDFPMIAAPLDVPVCLPADLLDRRPDLRASELRLKAANADVGVAVADLYPSLNLSGALGFSGTSTSGLFSPDQLTGSLLATVMGRIFEGGSLRANIRIQESEAREIAAGYADDVLNAMRDVETNLKADRELSGELANAEASLDALTKAADISQARYLRGIETLRGLLDAQRDLYATEQNLLNVQTQKWNARTALYLALGGDWLGQKSELNCSEGQINGR